MEWPLHPGRSVATPRPSLRLHSAREALNDSWVDSVNSAAPAFRLPRPDAEVSWAELPTPPHFPAPGDTFLGFRLVAELGRGAFGRVYLARQDDLAQRLVALKVSAEVQTESQNLAQLQHTNIVPVYSVHRTSAADGGGPLQAVCMPYFGSATLADILADLDQHAGPPPLSGKGLVSTIRDRVGRTRASLNGRDRSGSRPLPAVSPSASRAGKATADPDAPPADPQPTLRMLEGLTYVEAVLWLAERLADGLAHAHERGILHRDLKPANILLTDEGQPMLLDFNLSADLKTEASRARMGGTLPYIAPEHLAAFAGLPFPDVRRQGSGDRGQGAGVRGQGSGGGSLLTPDSCPLTPVPVDARSDVYALGVILYELLTRRAPFERPGGNGQEAVAEMIRTRLDTLPRVRPFNRSVTPAVEAIIRHCLEPDPSARYQSARQLVEDLERQRNQQPLLHAREPSVRERAAKWARRNRRGALLSVALLAVVLIAGLAWGLVAHVRDLARLDAAATLSAFSDDRDEAFFWLSARPDDAEERQEGQRRAALALARYGVLERPAWRDAPAVRNLPAQERQRLEEQVGELLLLSASVAEQTQKVTLIERAEDCFMADQAPRALYAHRAELASRRGDWADAGLWRDRAERCPLRNATDHYLLARDLAEAGRNALAVEHLRQAVRLEPKHFAAHFLLGNCYLDGAVGPGMQGALTEAVRCYSTCIALRPNFYGSYHNRGLAYFRMHQHASAEADFDIVLEMRPRLVGAYLQRGLAREGQHKLRPALADFTQAAGLPGAPTRVFFARARVHRLLGDSESAQQDELEGLRRRPGDEESYIARGVVRARTEPEGALADFREAVKLNPRSVAGLFNQALILAERLGRPQEAVGVLDQLIAFHPHLPTARASRGVLRARMGQREGAHKDAEEALKAAGQSGQILYQAACIYALTARQQAGDRHEAFRLLAQALQLGFGQELFQTEPDLATLRQEPRFREILRSVQALKTCAARGG